MIDIKILTLFPQMFPGVFETGIFKRAVDRGLVSVSTHNFRDWAHDAHHTVDDYPYGGGPGMVLKPEPLFEAVESIKAGMPEDIKHGKLRVVLLTPQGRPFTQAVARELSAESRLLFICGHYEGVDERVREHLVDDEISIGDYVLSGGELAAMVVVDALVRLLPGVLGSDESSVEESHAEGLLEYPQYTRPPEFRGWPVPEMLLSGNHGEIAKWRRKEAIRRTVARRPELLERANLTAKEKDLAKSFKV